MEKRLILAIVLSFALLAVYWIFFLNKPVPPPAYERGVPPAVTSAQPSVPETRTESQASPGEAAASLAAVQPGAPVQPVSLEREQVVKVETPLYIAEWSNRGAVLKSWKLKKYEEEQKTGEWLEMVNSEPEELKLSNRYPFALDADFNRRQGEAMLNDKINAAALFKPSVTSVVIRPGGRQELAFTYADESGLFVEKKFVFNGDGYDFDVFITFRQNGIEQDYRVLWGPGIGPSSLAVKRQRGLSNRGLAAFSAGKAFRMSEQKYKPDQSIRPYIRWAAYEETYFTSLFLMPTGQGAAVFQQELVNNLPRYYLAVSGAASAYIGPKEIDRVKVLDQAGTTKKLIQTGFFGGIVEILIVVIRAIHKVVPNWGLVIIILTIMLKILFFPLTYSSTKSMAKMQEIQPKIKALRAKYKKHKTDIAMRRQMNEEMMKLYKEHGVNPAGGCLPMLIQLPVFWAIFSLLSAAIELRHSPFVFWIKDLSVKDPILVTPILMGITQFISQKMTPTGADPTQARMMLIMPVIMTFFFLGFPSGLVLYWLTSNVLQIAQQHIMNRLQARKKREASENSRRKK
ncbi:MAG: membrane protein insertase YidC [Candidatus Aminicenantes bacterium]|nr:membrane protein insertase YidC [Candidatus Aminicenantes bacterium]